MSPDRLHPHLHEGGGGGGFCKGGYPSQQDLYQKLKKRGGGLTVSGTFSDRECSATDLNGN